MNTIRASRDSCRPVGGHGARRGFSLLEVLIACGVLLLGLASIASVLPAAAARLREAANEDRAGNMAAAALAEFQCRGLAFRNLFLSTTTTSTTFLSANQAVVFGQVLPGLPTVVSSTTVVGLQQPGTEALAARIDLSASGTNRGFFLEDELQFVSGGTAAPMNSFVNGIREFRRGVCWAAMVEPFPWGTAPANMRAARATIAVFRAPGQVQPGAVQAVQRFTLTGTAGGVFTIVGGTAAITTSGTSLPDDTFRKRFLAPCAPVLAVAWSGTSAPQWLTVNSSWPMWASGTNAQAPQTARPTSYGVVFREQASVYQSLVPSGTLQVVGFENIQGIAQQTFTIE